MSQRTTRFNPLQIASPVSRGLLIAAAVLVLNGSGSATTLTATLSESVVQCVPCHRSEEMDQVSEWLASPYSANEGGLGCVDCHRTQCSGTRPDEPIDRATAIENLEALRRALRLNLTATRSGDVVEAEVAVTNAGVGHHVPTGSAERSLVLEVVARDQDEEPLRPSTAPRSLALPPRGIRLAPFATYVSQHLFEAPGDGPVQVAARLLLISANGSPIELANTTTVCSSSTRSK